MNDLSINIDDYNVSVYLRNVTPKFASEILAKFNTKNRKVLPSHVAALANNMINGTWRFNGDTIRFDANGTLIDGQHRLMAIVKSGKTIPCLFVVGLDPDTIKCVDIAIKPRNLKNLLEMDFVKDAGLISASIRRRFVIAAGSVGVTSIQKSPGGNVSGLGSTVIDRVATIEEQYSFYYEHESVINELVSLGRTLYKRCQLLGASDIGGVAIHLVVDLCYNYERVKDFFEAILQGSPIQYLNSIHLMLVRDKTSVKKMTGMYRQSLIAKVWNYFAKGKEVKYVNYNPERDGFITFK